MLARCTGIVLVLGILASWSPQCAATLTSGGGGSALFFDGHNDFGLLKSNALLCGKNNPFAFKNFTIEFWIKNLGSLVDIQNDIGTVILSQLGETGVNVCWAPALEYELRFHIAGASDPCYSTFHHPPYNEWVHLAMSYGGQEGGMLVNEMWINGNRTSQFFCPWGTSKFVDSQAVLSEYFVGAYYSEKCGESLISRPLHGYLDEMRVWKTLLTGNEIRSRMHRTLTPQERLSPDLIWYWDFDEGQGSTVHDQSPNGLDLKLGWHRDEFGLPRTEWLPTWVPSTAPIVGRNREVPISQTAVNGRAVNASKPLATEFYLTASSSSQTWLDHSASAVSATVLSLPDFSTGKLYYGSTQITSVPFALPAPAPGQNRLPLSFTPALSLSATAVETLVTFNYSLTAGVENSGLQVLELRIKPNRRPSAGTAGHAMHCDGKQWLFGESFYWPVKAHAKWDDASKINQVAPDSHRTGGGAMTFELWSLVWFDELGKPTALLGVGNSEDCLSDTPEFRADPENRCRGRFMGHLPWEDGVAYFQYGAEVIRYSSSPFTPYHSRWVHVAQASCGFDQAGCNGDQMRLFFDGELVYETDNAQANLLDLTGIYLCTWPYHNTEADLSGLNHVGMIDEVRLWNYSRSSAEIKRDMNRKLPPHTPGLMGYWSFDELPESANFDDSITLDGSGHGHDLMLGGCPTPGNSATFPRSLCEKPGIKPQKEGNRIVKGSPTRHVSNAPVGGFEKPRVMNARQPGQSSDDSRLDLVLHGFDADTDDVLSFVLVDVPSADFGTLFDRATGVALGKNSVLARRARTFDPLRHWTIDDTLAHNKPEHLVPNLIEPAMPAPQLFYVAPEMASSPNAGTADQKPYVSFSYRVTDGLAWSDIARVDIHILCLPGTQSVSTTNGQHRCQKCAPGSFQPGSGVCHPCPMGSFASQEGAVKCDVAPVGFFVSAAGATSAEQCPDGAFAPTPGLSKCLTCSADLLAANLNCAIAWVRCVDLCTAVSNPVHAAYFTSCISEFKHSTGLRYALLGIACLGLAVCAGVSALLFIHRKRPSIRASSIRFMLLIMAGCAMAFITVILLHFWNPSESICKARIWVGHLAFSMMFGALFAKTYRLAVIFDRNELRHVVVTDIDLLKILGVFTASITGFLLAWTLSAPPTPTISRINLKEFTACETDPQFWEVLPIIFEAFWCAYGAWLTYRTRNLPQEFNESFHIFVAIWQMTVIAAIISFTSALNDPEVAVGVQAIAILVTAFVVMLTLTVPKFMRIGLGKLSTSMKSLTAAAQSNVDPLHTRIVPNQAPNTYAHTQKVHYTEMPARTEAETHAVRDLTEKLHRLEADNSNLRKRISALTSSGAPSGNDSDIANEARPVFSVAAPSAVAMQPHDPSSQPGAIQS